jgi:hypothetical protein
MRSGLVMGCLSSIDAQELAVAMREDGLVPA